MNSVFELDADAIASHWLSSLAAAFASKNLDALTGLFIPDGYLRDILTFRWDFRTIQGRAQIKEFLSADPIEISNIALDESSPHLAPSVDESMPGSKAVLVAFTYETANALGRGYARLVADPRLEDYVESWQAQFVFMMVRDWKGREEIGCETGIYDGARSWADVQEERRKLAETNPDVLIIGAGHVGLQVAARFRQMGITTLIIEKEARVGDNWRKRYPSLRLHVPKAHSHLLYQSFPTTWPEYTSKDKLAGWLEQYAISQELAVWTSSTILPKPTYDLSTKKWTIVVSKSGKDIILQPAHLVMAISTLGDGIIPTDIPGQTSFAGLQVHSSKFPGGAYPHFAGEGTHVLVIGAGNSASDICYDLHAHNKSARVTLVQRSATCVVSHALVEQQIQQFFPARVPLEVSDFKNNAMPKHLVREVMRMVQPMVQEFDREMREGLTKAGFELTDGPDGAGHLLLGITRGGGYFIDFGCSALIADGTVKVKQGVEIARMTEKTVIFSDGSELEADAIVYATGFEPIRDTYRRILGDSIVDKTPQVWGLDKEGEVLGVYKPTGQAGLWYAAGDFAISRFHSKHLALLVKACQLGLYVQ